MSESVTATDVATAKARTWGEIQIEIGMPGNEAAWVRATSDPMESVAKAQAWIEANGKDNNRYRLVRVVQTVKVKAQNIRKVELETV